MTESFPEAPVACPSCGQPVAAEERFCASCNYDLGEPEYACPSCAGTVTLAERYCGSCGFDFEAPATAEERREAAAEPETAAEPEIAREEAGPAVTVRPVSGRRDPVTGAVLAGWGSRAGAWLLDLVVIGVALGILTSIDLGLGSSSAAVFLGPPLYFWLLIGANGQTLGKMAVSIHVRRSEDAERVSYARALGRVVAGFFLWVLFLPILLSYLWPLWDRRSQTLHDKLAGTIVVRG